MSGVQYTTLRLIGWITLVCVTAKALGMPIDWRLWVMLFLSQLAEFVMMRLMPRRHTPVENR